MKLTEKKLAKLPPSARPRPWRRRRPRPYRRELVTLDRPPVAQIDIYGECVILTRRRENGAWTSYPVSPDALAQALGKLPVTTGLLPPGLIGYGMREGVPFYVQYIPARVVTLQLDDGGRYLSRQIPLPPLIWAGWGRDYRIWAVPLPLDELTDRATLYAAPFPNLFTNASICWGNVGRPAVAAPATLRPMLRLFLEESRFNGHLDGGKSVSHPGSVLRLYAQLQKEKATAYPLADLVPAKRSLATVLDGSVWGTP